MTVPEPSQEELLRLWESGVPLDSARVKFAVFFDEFAHRALRAHPDNDADVLGLDHPRYKELIKGWLPRTWEARKQKLAITTKNERIHLLDEIYGGRLWAIGLRTSDLHGERVRIPPELFRVNKQGALARPSKIDWIEEKLTTAEGSYFHLRVVSPSTANQTADGSPPVGFSLPNKSNESGSLPPEIDRIMSEFKSAGESYIDLSGVRPRSEDQTVESDDGTRATRPGRPPIDPRIQPKIEELWKLASFRAIKSRIRQAREVRAQILGEEYRDKDGTPNLTTRMIARLIGKYSKAQLRQSTGLFT
jgi:hypothetical protein